MEPGPLLGLKDLRGEYMPLPTRVLECEGEQSCWAWGGLPHWWAE